LDVGFEKFRLKERGINADSHSSLRKRRAKIMVGTKQKLRDLGPNDHDSVVISNSRNVNIFEEMVYNKGPNENKADGRKNLQRKIRQNSSRPQKPSMNKRRKSVKDNIIDISRRRNYYLEYQGLSMSMITNNKSPTPVPNKSPTGEPSRLQPSSGECIEPNKRITILNKRLKKVSGNSINNIKIPQGQAAEWLFSVDSINQCDPTVEQRYALAVFYFSTNGDDWYKNTGWLTAESECTWFAIECDDLGRLTKIGASQNFIDNGLSGYLPPELKVFDVLRNIQLAYNMIGGSIPKELGKLKSLVTLDLEENTFSQAIPDEIYSIKTLENLLLGGNFLEGSISKEVGGLVNLKALSLSQNRMKSQLPETLGNLGNLELLYMYGGDQFSGALPSGIGDMKALKELRIENNSLSGKIPSKIFQLQYLEIMSIADNHFSGSLPDVPGLVNLIFLNASNNALDGPLPSNSTSWKNLSIIDLHSNEMTGEIPTGFYDLSNLKLIYLHANSFSGSIKRLDGWMSAEDIYLQDNEFSGNIPSIGPESLRDLEELLLQGNTISGNMPESICELRQPTSNNKSLVNLWADCIGAVPVNCSVPACCTRCF